MSGRFEILDLPLPGLLLLQRKRIGDDRGYLERIFCAEELALCVHDRALVQINRTLTGKRGTLRGLHFQHAPHAETKIISCLHGEVFDVAVDLRPASPTYLKWHAEILSADNHRTLVIPEGFAHGFQTLTDDCEMLYLHTKAYCADAEGGVRGQDPALAIDWPITVTELSMRDAAHPLIDDRFKGVTL